jgi:hypothetical protein
MRWQLWPEGHAPPPMPRHMAYCPAGHEVAHTDDVSGCAESLPSPTQHMSPAGQSPSSLHAMVTTGKPIDDLQSAAAVAGSTQKSSWLPRMRQHAWPGGLQSNLPPAQVIFGFVESPVDTGPVAVVEPLVPEEPLLPLLPLLPDEPEEPLLPLLPDEPLLPEEPLLPSALASPPCAMSVPPLSPLVSMSNVQPAAALQIAPTMTAPRTPRV